MYNSVEEALFKLQNLQEWQDWRQVLWQWLKEGRVHFKVFKGILDGMADHQSAKIAKLEKDLKKAEWDLQTERDLWCDKPEDRLYHAADKSWWQRDQQTLSPKRAEPPQEIVDMAEGILDVVSGAKFPIPVVEIAGQIDRADTLARELRRDERQRESQE